MVSEPWLTAGYPIAHRAVQPDSGRNLISVNSKRSGRRNVNTASSGLEFLFARARPKVFRNEPDPGQHPSPLPLCLPDAYVSDADDFHLAAGCLIWPNVPDSLAYLAFEPTRPPRRTRINLTKSTEWAENKLLEWLLPGGGTQFKAKCDVNSQTLPKAIARKVLS